MEKFEHPLLIVHWINLLLGGVAVKLHGLFGKTLTPDHEGHVIPPYLAIVIFIVAVFVVLGLMLRSRLSVEHPGKFQIILEDLIGGLAGMLEQWLGPKGVNYLPLIGTLGAFILAGNYLGLIPGFMSPTSSINVTIGCALTTWVFYHLQGVRAHGVFAYIKHFAVMPGVPVMLSPMIFVIEIISHLSRVMSLSLRLFGNIFGEELVIAILAYLSPTFFPFFPLPMMFLGLITGGLQAFIFVLLSIIYLQGATHVDHEHDHGDPSHGSEHGARVHDHGHAPGMAKTAAA